MAEAVEKSLAITDPAVAHHHSAALNLFAVASSMKKCASRGPFQRFEAGEKHWLE